uniref:GH18 domain-containing protein n=1 Tax=Anopheles merus TaxID=30066 RepID=A0A182V1F7_ANOME
MRPLEEYGQILLAVKMLCSVVFLVLISITIGATKNIVCYYDSRAANYVSATFPKNISPTSCTHYVYDGVGVTAQGDIRILSNYDTASGFDEFQNIRRTKNVKLYVLLSSDRDGGKNLTNSTLARFVNRLRSRLYMINKQLSVSVSAQFADAYDITSLSLYADMINLHAYNFTTNTANTVANLAPLFSSTPFNAVSVNSTVTSWLAAGARRNKVNLVVATFGRTYVLASEDQRAVGARSTGPGEAGFNTKRPGLIARYEFCNIAGEYNSASDSVTATTYYFKGKSWIGIETEDTLVQKFTYVLDSSLGGVAIFTLDLDDTTNTCGNGAYRVSDLAYQYFASE